MNYPEHKEYIVGYGCMGYIPEKEKYQQFATEKEYEEYLECSETEETNYN